MSPAGSPPTDARPLSAFDQRFAGLVRGQSTGAPLLGGRTAARLGVLCLAAWSATCRPPLPARPCTLSADKNVRDWMMQSFDLTEDEAITAITSEPLNPCHHACQALRPLTCPAASVATTP